MSGSRLNHTVPLKRIGIYGMIVILSLRSESPSLEISTPSINIYPSLASMILHRVKQSVDLPAPVLPTTPIFYPASIFRFRLLSTRSVSSQYLALKFLNSISPHVPNPAGIFPL